MRVSQFPFNTIKETPADAEVISHQLMLRAGLMRRLASGLYTWLPMGLRVLRKVENIVREEMEKAGALEVLMPAAQPAELWQESGRWEQYGPELLRFNDRHNREFCYGPTHEEVITDLARRELSSYKQLPICYYQVQTKFRDEIRPRFGVMRAREFIMKDAYSFHNDQASLQQTYDVMYQAYTNIFSRLGLEFRAVLADTGSIGGSASHEFHVLANSGEDAIAFSTESDYAANVELAEAITTASRGVAGAAMSKVATPGQKTIEEVTSFLKVEAAQVLKTLLVHGAEEGQIVALVVRGDHELNDIKAEKLNLVKAPLQFASDAEVEAATGCKPGSIGPVGLTIPVIVDRSAAIASNFVCGANEDGFHLQNVNWGRDTAEPVMVADIRNVVDGDPSPCGKGVIRIARGIEVGHIFQLGNKYSQALNASVLDENGKQRIMTMGCYGIGISRVVAAAIEQNHDANGIIWPQSIAPFHVAVVAINMQKSDAVRDAATKLYADLQAAGFDVLFDDRDARPGVKFADLELTGIPHRIVVGERGLNDQVVEYKGRTDAESQNIALDSVVTFITGKLA